MKKLMILFVLFIAITGYAKQPEKKKVTNWLPDCPVKSAVWKQTFRDDFKGGQIDPNNWNVRHIDRTCRDKNFWHRDCAKLNGKGGLRMITRKSPGKQGWHDTACVETRNKFTQCFGYFEIRAKMHSQPGFWTAFWAMPADGGMSSTEHLGMDGSELDIYEKNTLDDAVQHTLHWDGYGKAHKSKGARPKVAGVMKGFHNFGLLWTPDEYVFYIDSKETWRTNAGGVAQVSVYLKVSAEKGTWAGDIAKAKLPDEFVVDHVKAYQLYLPDGRSAFKAKDFTKVIKKK